MPIPGKNLIGDYIKSDISMLNQNAKKSKSASIAIQRHTCL